MMLCPLPLRISLYCLLLPAFAPKAPSYVDAFAILPARARHALTRAESDPRCAAAAAGRRGGGIHASASEPSGDGGDDGEQESSSPPVECFVTNEDGVVLDGEKAEVVCTSDPDEYAWFNGVDRSKMRPTDGTSEGTTECVEGASPTGKPEWECK